MHYFVRQTTSMSWKLGAALMLTACASSAPERQESDARDNSPTLVVTGSRIPHRVPGGKPDSVKTISREGFEEDMRSNQMPHRQGN